MESWQGIVSVVNFVAIIVLLMTDKISMVVLALLGSLVLVVTNILTLTEAIDYIAQNHNTLGLFLGIMIMVRAFQPTKIFEWLARQIVFLSGGKGSRLILGLILLTSVASAFLPNATVVLLLAPIIPPLAEAIALDFVPLLILIALTANSAGLLTLVGDPVQFIVAEALNITFIDYLFKLSLSGVVSVVVLVLIVPVLFRKIWRSNIGNYKNIPEVEINHPRVLGLGFLIVVFVLVFFVIGQSLNPAVSPATVALVGAALAMLISDCFKIETVGNILRDVDWSTLIFFMSFFVMTGALEHTGVITSLSKVLGQMLSDNIVDDTIIILFIVAFLSSLVPNIPLIAALVPLFKEVVANQNFTPAETLPVFYALILGGTLGGNGTLLGASANLVAAGIAQQYNEKINFNQFLKYGLPITILQLIAAAMFLLITK